MPYYQGDYYMAGPVPLLPAAGALASRALPFIGRAGTFLQKALPSLAKAAGVGAAVGVGEQLVERAGEALGGGGGGGGRAYRRMNVLNPRALRRSMRRVEGFARFARKTIGFTKRVHMKKRRRR